VRCASSRSITARQLGGDRVQPLRDALHPAGAPIDEIHGLNRGQHKGLSDWRAGQREDHLALRPRHREFGKAPFRRQPVRRQHQQDRVAARELLVEALLPILARADPCIGVETGERVLEAHARQRRFDVVGDFLVPAGVTDENRRHLLARS